MLNDERQRIYEIIPSFRHAAIHSLVGCCVIVLDIDRAEAKIRAIMALVSDTNNTGDAVRILITGVNGFVGRHLAQHLHDTQPHAELLGTTLSAAENAPPHVNTHALNLCDPQATSALIRALQPDQIYHLAGSAVVGKSHEAAWSTLENNIRAQLNILLACIDVPIAPRMLIISSGDIYGANHPTPPDEHAPFFPTSPYSVSKIAQDMLGLQYYLSHDLPVLRARPFNHTGPGQSLGFVAPDFAMQIARIETGQQAPIMHVGDLTPERDFTDVRDIVRAYRLIMQHGEVGAVYNIASGMILSIRQLLDGLLAHTQAPIRIEIDTDRLRAGGARRLWGNAALLHAVTGWQPQIALEDTLSDLLADWRKRVGLTV